MNVTQKGATRLAASNVLARDTLCSSCRLRIPDTTSRRHASAAAAVAEQPAQVHPDPSAPAPASGPQKAFKLACSPLLSRPPLLTRELTSFEKAYYLYQKRLNERLALPFTRYFYYKRGTPADVEWKRKAKARKGVAARDVGLYNAYGKEGWNDEVLVGSRLGEPDEIVERLIRDAEGKDIEEAKLQGDAEAGNLEVSGDPKAGEGVRKPVGDIAVRRPMPRATEADQKNDLRSLSRKLDRTLYLLVKREDGHWRFPQDRVYGRENLHQAAERILIQAGGINMNTWVVGNHPVGHYTATYRGSPILSKIPPNRLVSTSKEELEQEEHGEKVFFMKSRIMAGQADMSKNELGDQEFQWLTKEEVQQKVQRHYWSQVQNMLTER